MPLDSGSVRAGAELTRREAPGEMLRFSRAQGGAWLRGAPSRRTLALLVGLGAGASALLASPVSAALVAVAVPAALMVTRRPRRGQRALARALRLRRADADAGDRALRELVGRRRVAAAIRLEAAGRLAAEALERGDIADAVGVLDSVASERSRRRPRGRALGLGLIGELMRSILCRLGVSRFERVAESPALAPGNPQAPADEDDRAAYVGLLGMLEVLEADAGAPEPVLEAAWRRAQASVLGERYPGLALITTAVASRRLPAARSELERHIEGQGGVAPVLLAGLFPELVSELGEHGYRRPGVAGRTHASLARYRPPDAITSLVSTHDRGSLALGFGSISMLGAGPLTVLALLLPGIWPAVVLGFAGLITNRVAHRLRAGPVAAMPLGPSNAWLRELFDTPDAPLPLGDRRGVLRSEALALYMCCVRAEQALAKGEASQAWDWVAWWFADRDDRRPAKLSLHPVASTLLRVACLSNHVTEARSLAGLVEPGPSQRFRVARRTVYGDAPRALALAKALVYARACAWNEAARALAKVSGQPGVIMSERDEVLYALVAQRVQGMISTVDPRLCSLSPRSIERVRPFLVRVWPQLVPRARRTSPPRTRVAR